VYIEFRTNKLRRCYERQRARDRAWGREVAERYVVAVDLITEVDDPYELADFPQYAYHTLTGDRKGQHVMELGYRARLIFTVQEGGRVLVAWVEEVTTTHYEH
jgi:toxin HigB-1